MTTQDRASAQVEGLATLLVLNDEIRRVNTLREYGFFTTNETHRLIPYHTAFLWKKAEPFGIDLLSQSGTAELDKTALINQWLKERIATITRLPDNNKIHTIDLFELEKTNPSENTNINWTDTLPNHVLWCPLLTKSQELNGGLLFFRDNPFSEAEIKMIGWLISSYQYTWISFSVSKRWEYLKYLKKKPVIFAVLIILLFPVRLSVLATATVVPKDPVLINAPIQGVIKSFAVSPGQTVKAGQTLFYMDKSELESAIEVSRKELLLTQAKLRTAVNQGIDSEQINAEVPILKAQLAIDNARIEYTKSLIEKTVVNSPIAGVVVFNSKEDWVGQPVQTGERILTVSNPEEVQLKIMLPITSVIDLDVGNAGDFFMYGDLRSIGVTIKSLGYNAKMSPSKILAYELTAQFDNQSVKIQLGAQGTVRLYGHRVPLFYYLIRRPLQSIRQSLGI